MWLPGCQKDKTCNHLFLLCLLVPGLGPIPQSRHYVVVCLNHFPCTFVCLCHFISQNAWYNFCLDGVCVIKQETVSLQRPPLMLANHFCFAKWAVRVSALISVFMSSPLHCLCLTLSGGDESKENLMGGKIFIQILMIRTCIQKNNKLPTLTYTWSVLKPHRVHTKLCSIFLPFLSKVFSCPYQLIFLRPMM